MKLETARFNMIEQQIRPWEVLDQTVLSLLATVRREDFVPPAMRALAFVDTQVPLVAGEPGGPHMIEPKLEARLLQELQVQRHEKVLEIGTGSGYMTALLAHLAQRVISLEINPEIANMARANLQRAGIHNVEVRLADGSKGTPAEAPFDVILLGGSVAEVPQPLLNLLKVGGRLVAIVGDEPIMHAQVVTRTSETNFTSTDKWDDNAPRLLNFPQPSPFKF